MNEWKSSGGRITLLPLAQFPSSPPLSALELYKKVWREDPDNFQKSTNPLMPTVAQGRRGNLLAGCAVHPTRTDFTLTPSTPQEEVHGTFPLIEDTGLLYAELLRTIDGIDQVLLQLAGRVALSVAFVALKPSSAEANKTLTSVIPDQYGVKLRNEEDFIFQINQPYSSRSVDGVTMNSLTKWSVERLQILTIALPVRMAAPSQASSAATRQTEQFIAANVHFDINNVPKETPVRQPVTLLREALNAVAQMQQAIGLKIEGFENAELSH